MIKRITVFSLMLVYLSTTAGFALNLHFCGSKVSQVGINQTRKTACCKAEAEGQADKCCKDKHIQIKVSDKQQAVQSAKVPVSAGLDLFVIPGSNFLPSSAPFAPVSRYNYRGPPLHSSVPLTIQNCIFRI